MIEGPKWGLGPVKKFLGAKNWKIAIGAYSSQLITPERKRISERLKRPRNCKSMAYKMYVRPWPLTPGCKHSDRFCTYKYKNFRFLAIFSKFSAVRPIRTLAVNSARGALQVWKILWTWTNKRRWTIRLKNLEFLRSAFKSHIRPLVIRKIGRISKKENKLVNLRYVGYITANLHKIFIVVAEIGLPVYKSTKICVLINSPIFANLQKFSAVTPVKFSV